MKTLLALVLFGSSLPVACALTIVTFGDSVTAPRGQTAVYSNLLADELTFDGENVQVINAGAGGHTTKNGKDRLQKDVLDRQPEVAVIMFGINDAAIDVWKMPPATAPRVALAEYRQNLAAIAQALRKQGARVVLMTSNPLSWSDTTRKLYGQAPYLPEDADGFNVLLRDYVQAVREIAKQEGVGLIDVFAAFQAHEAQPPRQPGSLARDGMHPDDTGHRLIADLLMDHLTAADRRFARKPPGTTPRARPPGLAGANLTTPGAAVAFRPVEYRVQLDVVSEGYDGKFCWFHPRAGAIPGASPTIVLTMQRWRFAASDVFYPVSSQWTRDLGKTWSSVVEHTAALGRRRLPNGHEEGICDFTPKWHARTGTLLGTGHTVAYDEQDKLVKVRPRSSVWSIYLPEAQTWSPWAALKMPPEPRFNCAGAGSTQRVDLENGEILLPIYSKEMNEKAYFTTVVPCSFDGKTLTYTGHGSELKVDIDRGLYEPSLAKFGGKYFLTMRNDRAAYVAVSDDGLHFHEPRKWTFDDGADLGSYNTQAHWLTHSDGLFLSYTRRGANNDHVARHRAPLFLAQIDPERLVVLRATEREIVPNKGAQLGNFAVVDVNEHETWVTTSEGMSPGEPQKFGANGRVYAARIQWAKPNAAWNRH